MSQLAVQTGAGPADVPPVVLPHPVRMRILGAVMVGVFLGALDQTVVGTAMPRIITELHGTALYTWAFTAYLLTSTISGPLYGKASDLIGRRPVFLFGIGVFMTGSLMSGLSGEMWQLVAARGVQGLGAGALFPIAMATIGDLFAPSERGRYQGLFGAVFGLSSLLGPGIGGLLTDTVGWHWVFFVNLPVGAAVLAVVSRSMPAYRASDTRPRVDIAGAVLFTAALVPILAGLTNRASAEWTDPSVGGLIAVGALVLAAFVWAESRAAEPIVPLGLFRIRAFTLSVAAMFLAAAGWFAAAVFLPRWFQVVGGTSATVSGYEMLPLLGGVIAGAVGAGQAVARTGRHRTLIFGALASLAVGLALLTQLRADTPLPLLWAAMLVTGLGMGPVLSVFPLVVQSAVPIRQLGTASSSLSFFQQIGGTVGLAITGTVFASTLADQVPAAMRQAGVPHDALGALAHGGGIQALSGAGTSPADVLASLPANAQALVAPHLAGITAAVHQAFSIATSSTFGLGIATAAAAAGLVLLFHEPAKATAAADDLGWAAFDEAEPGAEAEAA